MELYQVGLSLLVRDDSHRSTCVGQAVIMIIAAVMTAVFQLLLNAAFGPCLSFLPYTDIEVEPETENRARNGTLHRLSNLSQQGELQGLSKR